MRVLKFGSMVVGASLIGSSGCAQAKAANASVSGDAPPVITIDRCGAHPWYLAFVPRSETTMLPIAQRRVSEMVERWKQDHGPVLIAGGAPHGKTAQLRQKYVAGLLTSRGIDPGDIYFKSPAASVNSAAVFIDPDFTDVVQIKFPYEGKSCRARVRGDRVAWLAQHCTQPNGRQSETCRAQIEALETD